MRILKENKKRLINFFLAVTAILFIGYAYPTFTERVGNTQLNGEGCVCHTLLTPSPEIFVVVEGPDTLFQNQTAVYRMLLAGPPGITGGYNVAARFGTLGLVDTTSILRGGELTQSFPLPFPTPTDTIFWDFSYTAPDSLCIDTIYSAGISCDGDMNPLTNDYWNFGPKFPVVVIPGVVPVELTILSAKQLSANEVKVEWKTASETNNYGFEIEVGDGDYFEKSSFVKGNGTTTNNHFYSTIIQVNKNFNSLRLKQIDYDGSFSYSKIIHIDLIADRFILEQNYPNPFNPATYINYSIPSDEFVTIKIFNIIGKEIATLVNSYQKAGNYSVEFNASDLSSGIYFYTISAGSYRTTKKMILSK